MKVKFYFLFFLFYNVLCLLKIPKNNFLIKLNNKIINNKQNIQINLNNNNNEIIERNQMNEMNEKNKKNEINQNKQINKNNIIKFSFLMLLWYFFTVIYNISNKNSLNSFPLPATVSTLQLIVGLPLFLPLWTIKLPSIPRSEIISFAFMAFTHALGIFTSVLALEAGSVSFTHVVKSAEPVFAALFSKLLLHQTFSLPTYLSLIPIIGGVALSSMTDFTFSLRSFIPAMLSNVFHQLRIVLSKRSMLKSSPSSPSSSNSTTITSKKTIFNNESI